MVHPSGRAVSRIQVRGPAGEGVIASPRAANIRWRRSAPMIALFTGLIVLQFVVVVSHDLVDVSDWVRGSQVQAVMGRRKIWLATLVNSIFPGIAAGFALYFWNRPKPL